MHEARTVTDTVVCEGRAASLAELFSVIAREKAYLFQALESVLILEARGPDEFIVCEYSGSEG
jgi:hypothetical protein